MHQLFKTLPIVALIATIYGLPVSEEKNEEIDTTTVADTFGSKDTSVSPKEETVMLKPDKENKEFMKSIIARIIFGPKGPSIVRRFKSKQTQGSQNFSGATNELQENQSELSAGPQNNCTREKNAGVCLKYYFCKTPLVRAILRPRSTDSDDYDYDSSSSEEDTNNHGQDHYRSTRDTTAMNVTAIKPNLRDFVTDFCPFEYLEACCSVKDRRRRRIYQRVAKRLENFIRYLIIVPTLFDSPHQAEEA
ncbi:hypothetical protein O0L34_g17475 [Tuta absoluta]|nr:hypothetical protein O0L34_g17475 [Tuta absoluta]